MSLSPYLSGKNTIDRCVIFYYHFLYGNAAISFEKSWNCTNTGEYHYLHIWFHDNLHFSDIILFISFHWYYLYMVVDIAIPSPTHSILLRAFPASFPPEGVSRAGLASHSKIPPAIHTYATDTGRISSSQCHGKPACQFCWFMIFLSQWYTPRKLIISLTFTLAIFRALHRYTFVEGIKRFYYGLQEAGFQHNFFWPPFLCICQCHSFLSHYSHFSHISSSKSISLRSFLLMPIFFHLARLREELSGL